MPASDLTEALLTAVDADLDVRLTRELVRVPSVVGEEEAIGLLLESQARALGFEAVRREEVYPGRYNTIGHLDFGPGPELLQRVLVPLGVAPEEIPDPIGVFMHTVPDPATRVMTIQEPLSRAGDRFSFRAEADLLLAMSTCPMDVIAPTNGYRITPLLVEVLAAGA